MVNQNMTPKEQIFELLQGWTVSPVLFLPAIYDYKARLAGIPPHLFGIRSEEIVFAMERELKESCSEVLTSGYDIYNVEAEALGATLIRNERIGMPDIKEPILRTIDKLSELHRLTAPAGRMNVFVNAAKIAVDRWGSTIPVRGAISGPFSMASKLFANDDLIMGCIINPDGIKELLTLCTQTAILYANEFLASGAQVIVFDSFVVPPMLSPELYRDIVLPFHKELFGFLKQKGVVWRPLIVGGDTRLIIPHLTESGANQLLLDYSVPIKEVADILDRFPHILFRYNLSPLLMQSPTVDNVINGVAEIAGYLKGKRNLILGTAVLPVNTPLVNITSARKELKRLTSLVN
jgi:uroporphyrinogen decarboxylase